MTDDWIRTGRERTEPCGCRYEQRALTGLGAERWVQVEPCHHHERCPICGGLNPGDLTHMRCM